VRAVSAREATGSVRIEYDPRRLSKRALVRALRDIGVSLGVIAMVDRDDVPPSPSPARTRRVLALAGASAAVAATCLPVAPSIKAGLVVASGFPSLVAAGQALARRGRLSADLLEAVTLVLLTVRGQYGSAALLSWLRSLGDYLVTGMAGEARRSLRDAVVSPEEPVVRAAGDRRVTTRIGSIEVGDVIVVGAGHPLPVDGTVVSGEALVDQQTMTGEGLAVERRSGDRVFAATIVEDGEISVRVDRLGRATAVGRIVEAIEAAAVEKSEIQVFAENLLDSQVHRTLVLAGLGAVFSFSLDAGVAILVADYGMAARVGIPIAMTASLMRASRAGVLIKGSRALEALARVDTVVFDKTGTLTLGTPRVTRVVTYGARWTDAEVVGLTAAAELGLRHPIARAIARLAAEWQVPVPTRGHPFATVGLGVDVAVDGVRVQVGSRRFMESGNISLDLAMEEESAAYAIGASPTFVAVDGRLAALLVLQDELRGDARAVVAALPSRNVRDVVLLSGDHPEPTRVIADSLGLSDYHPQLLPEDKAALIRKLKRNGRVVAMVGDGVNDALALNEADVGIAVRVGPAVVTEAADVVLLRGGLDGVVVALDVASASIGHIQRTLRFAARANLAVVGLASFGLARPAASILLTRGATLVATLPAFLPVPSRSRARQGARLLSAIAN
jgi:heavy metal translocating P-type ATPase